MIMVLRYSKVIYLRFTPLLHTARRSASSLMFASLTLTPYLYSLALRYAGLPVPSLIRRFQVHPLISPICASFVSCFLGYRKSTSLLLSCVCATTPPFGSLRMTAIGAGGLFRRRRTLPAADTLRRMADRCGQKRAPKHSRVPPTGPHRVVERRRVVPPRSVGSGPAEAIRRQWCRHDRLAKAFRGHPPSPFPLSEFRVADERGRALVSADAPGAFSGPRARAVVVRELQHKGTPAEPQTARCAARERRFP